jgi:hypothetical protein
MDSTKQVEGSHLVRGLRAVNPWSISKHREISVYVLSCHPNGGQHHNIQLTKY